MQTVTITKGDTLLPLNFVIKIGDDPVDLSAYTVKALMVNAAGTVVVNYATTGVTAHPTSNFTVNTTSDRILKNAHGLANGDQIELTNSGGALPAGLATSTRYFVLNRHPNTFEVSLEPGGTKVDITGAGTGTHSYAQIGSVQYDLQTADAATAGNFTFHFTLWTGLERQHIPYDGDTLLVNIVAPSGV